MKPLICSRYKDRPGLWSLGLATLFTLLIAWVAQPQNTPYWAVPVRQTPQNLVDALQTAFGAHQARAVHAKGCSSKAALPRLSPPGC